MSEGEHFLQQVCPGCFSRAARLTLNAGPLQARISQVTGHIQLAGPDLSGAALANVVDVSPPASSGGRAAALLGAVLSSKPIGSGLAVQQSIRATPRSSRSLMTACCAMRSWNCGFQPQQTAIAGSSTAQEHFFGFGEKFDALDQAGPVVEMLTLTTRAPSTTIPIRWLPGSLSTRRWLPPGLVGTRAPSTCAQRRGRPGSSLPTASTLRCNLVYGPA